jgi:hypothetical protein
MPVELSLACPVQPTRSSCGPFHPQALSQFKRNASSQYKGVSWSKIAKKWKAEITINGKLIFLGYFHKEVAAARMYDARAVARRGSRPLNFPRDATAGHVMRAGRFLTEKRERPNKKKKVEGLWNKITSTPSSLLTEELLLTQEEVERLKDSIVLDAAVDSQYVLSMPSYSPSLLPRTQVEAEQRLAGEMEPVAYDPEHGNCFFEI